MRAPSKKSSIIAAVIWIVSVIFAFTIPPPSKFIWLPDALLLFGFYPLFISMRSAWLMLAFGVINFFVGFGLLIMQCAPKEELIRLEHIARFNLIETSSHVIAYHPYYVWGLIGILSAIIGLGQLLFRLFIWLYSLFVRAKT
jgi:hypothetical protein